ncbi:MAG TPA: 16S rRNA (guanine(527)-N(7))-methyltransferase RsmG [Chitinophagaceae bacterium]
MSLDIILKYFTDFSPVQQQQLQQLDAAYKDWNQKINVISRKDIDSLYEKHVLHSLAIAAAFDFPDGTEIVDLGTGGGFPGIPLAIYFPAVKFHLVDSIGKKLKVVEGVATAIGLNNITVQHARIEEVKNRKFDFVVSRAVAPLKDLWNWSKPLLKKEAITTRPGVSEPEATTARVKPGLICLKGGDLAKEIQESAVRPRILEIHDIFPEDFFREKYLLHVSR